MVFDVALPVALFDPMAVDPVAPLLLAPIEVEPVVPLGDWPAVAGGRLVLPEFAVPDVVCADTAAAMQKDTSPATRAGPEKRIFDMVSPRGLVTGSRRIVRHSRIARDRRRPDASDHIDAAISVRGGHR
jgi:hypothetical protein